MDHSEKHSAATGLVPEALALVGGALSRLGFRSVGELNLFAWV